MDEEESAEIVMPVIEVTLNKKDYFKIFGLVCAANLTTYVATVVLIGFATKREAQQ